MGGKKKSMANRLARMSDEERARYLQRKADIEEEAKRRKEQLIAIFMKNKIKKEDGFSRLNLAKINQHWHQILRMSKCKEMKEDVQHMKKFMGRALDYKNRTIKKLMEELEMAEEQYSHNFQSHFTHIDQMIESHQKYMTSMEEQYQKDLEDFLETSAKEHEDLVKRSTQQHEQLKTVIFAQETKFKIGAKNDFERYLSKKEEITSTFRIRLDSFTSQRENQCAALWRQIAAVVKAHVAQTDARRLHLAELKRLDAESAADIAYNQERISKKEVEIKHLNQQFETLTLKHSETVQNLKKKVSVENAKFHSARKFFRKEVETDTKQITLLTTASNRSIDVLEKLKTKGEQILNLMMTCQKFETEREKVLKFQPLPSPMDVSIDEEEQEAIKKRASAKSDASGGEEMVKKVVISVKTPYSSPPSTSHSDQVDVISREFALLGHMENFWTIYNKVDIDYKELKQEKKMLLQQNKHFRGLIRAVLEAAALDQSTPGSKVPTRVASKKGSRSAPLRRILV